MASRSRKRVDVPERPISESTAVGIARESVRELAEVPDDINGVVTQEGDHYVVTFPTGHPSSVRGADFHAQVVIDPMTGKVLRILGGQ